MWLKARRRNALVGPLAVVVGGQVADGCLEGSYRDFQVKAAPHSGYPTSYASSPTGPSTPEPVNTIQVTLSGVAGGQVWHCQSSGSSYLHDLTSRFTAGSLLEAFKPGEFKFVGADPLHDSFEGMGEKLVKRLGIDLSANADPALQKRLIAAGLFGELDALRLGPHPYLPKVQFVPGAREMTEQIYMQSGLYEGMRPAIEERLRAHGMPDLRSAWEAKVREAEARDPGRLTVDVEAEDDGALSPDRFRDVLEHAVRIAQINAQVNRGVDAR